MPAAIKFTVIIPTRDRSDTLVHTLASVVNQDYDNFEILVSDNASEDGTAQAVACFADHRIKYVNTGQRLSMSHNWEFALSHVADGWLVLLGDDDALLPGSLQTAANIIQETGTQAIRSNGCTFSWPGLLGQRHGLLTVNLGKGYRKLNSGESLMRVLQGQSDYTNLPMLYNGGFIHSDLVNKAKSISEVFFRSMTPDVYSAMVFSLLTDDYIYSDAPLAINGASHHSGGTAAFEKVKRNRSYDPAAKFWSEQNISFHPDLPLLEGGRPVRSIQAIVYEAYLQATPYHGFKNLAITAAQQLQVILNNAGPHVDETRDWCRLFAGQHQLDFDDAASTTNGPGAALRANVKGIWQRMKHLLTTYSVDGSTFIPLNNVYEASVIAGSIKQARPGIALRLARVLSKLSTVIRRLGK